MAIDRIEQMGYLCAMKQWNFRLINIHDDRVLDHHGRYQYHLFDRWPGELEEKYSAMPLLNPEEESLLLWNFLGCQTFLWIPNT